MSLRIYVLDDASDDRTALRARRAGAQVVPATGRGLGAVFRQGTAIAAATECRWILQLDGDGQYPPGAIAVMLRSLDSSADLIIGNRLGTRPACMTIRRYIENVLASLAVSALTHRMELDAQSGLRLFTSEVARKCAVSGNFTYVREQVVLARRHGFEVAYTPVDFVARVSGRSRLASGTAHYIIQAQRDFYRRRRLPRWFGRGG